MQNEVGQVGYGPAYVATMLAAPLTDLVAVEFIPTAAFDQTPGLAPANPWSLCNNERDFAARHPPLP